MKEYVTLEPVTVAIPAGLLDQVLNAAIDALSRRIAQMVPEVRHDVGPVLLEHAHDLLDRFQSGGHGIAAPLLEVRHGVGLVLALPERAEQFLGFPSAGCLRHRLPQGFEAAGPLPGHVLQAIEPQLAGPFQRRIASRLHVDALATSNLIDGLIHMLGHMEVVEDDLVLGAGHETQRPWPRSQCP